jgi:hypothetical protein
VMSPLLPCAQAAAKPPPPAAAQVEWIVSDIEQVAGATLGHAVEGLVGVWGACCAAPPSDAAMQLLLCCTLLGKGVLWWVGCW